MKTEISIILPCRNEQEALPLCFEKIKKVIQENNLSAEIIVSDSSTDKSPEIARKNNAILIKHNKEGYGMAYLEAFKHAQGKYIFMADADCTYDFKEIPRFINELKKGYDFILGNRFGGIIEKGAMPPVNRYFGNPLLSGILRLFFHAKIKDSHCGMRAIAKPALDKLNLQTTGMEFASEMIVKALKNNLRIKELDINYYKRIGNSKLRPVLDAYKHMRFMLLYCPLFLFFIPGIFLFLLGIILTTANFFASSILMILGYQLVIFSAFAKIYSITHLKEKSEIFEKLFKYITIEKASAFGLLIFLLGLLFAYKNLFTALTFVVIGAQTIFSSFMFSILGIKEK